MRWPGSWHRKSTPRMAEIAEVRAAAEIELRDVASLLEDAARLTGVAVETAGQTSANATPIDLDDELAALVVAMPNAWPDGAGEDVVGRWNEWNRTGMAFWAATGGSEAGRAAFQAWSAQRRYLRRSHHRCPLAALHHQPAEQADSGHARPSRPQRRAGFPPAVLEQAGTARGRAQCRCRHRSGAGYLGAPGAVANSRGPRCEADGGLGGADEAHRGNQTYPRRARLLPDGLSGPSRSRRAADRAGAPPSPIRPSCNRTGSRRDSR